MVQAAALIAKEPIALQLRYLQTMREMASEHNTTTFLPLPIDLFSAFLKKRLIKPPEPILIMPLYEYELCEGDCKVCGGKFTLRRPLSAAPLTKCPACKKPVRKVFSTFNSPKTLSISDAKKGRIQRAQTREQGGI